MTGSHISLPGHTTGSLAGESPGLWELISAAARTETCQSEPRPSHPRTGFMLLAALRVALLFYLLSPPCRHGEGAGEVATSRRLSRGLLAAQKLLMLCDEFCLLPPCSCVDTHGKKEEVCVCMYASLHWAGGSCADRTKSAVCLDDDDDDAPRAAALGRFEAERSTYQNVRDSLSTLCSFILNQRSLQENRLWSIVSALHPETPGCYHRKRQSRSSR